ncbi:MAG TPA: hypothetical protein VGJ66_18195 [Pyrinomonadaceae bacterium]|jgi:hypothetical protein
MPGPILTTSSTITCTHGGQAILLPANFRVSVDGGFALLESGIYLVIGCPFTVGTKYSPCIRIEWTAGASKLKINDSKVLVRSSIGKCINAEGAPQGVALILNTQTKATAQ